MSNTLQVAENGVSVAAKSARKTAPLSFAQEQIWLHAQLVPQLPIYNEPVTIQRRGKLEIAVLQRALTEIVRRHETWRTTFATENGEPVQVINPQPAVEFGSISLTHLADAERESEARRLAVENALLPFNLSQGPLFRALLAQFGDAEYRLFLTFHHIIFDGYSIYRVFLPELAALYEAFAAGQESPLKPLSSQYANFAVWQRQSFTGSPRFSQQMAYWRNQLDGISAIASLPSDRPRPAAQTFRGAIHPIAFSKDTSDELKRLSLKEGATPFMGLIAIFSVLISRYSASEDVVIGTVSSGRKRSELEKLLGYFLNPLVLRTNLSGNPTFRELLRRTREISLDALSNDDVPFAEIVRELHPDRSLSFNPLFQVLLTLEPKLPEMQDGWAVMLTQSEVDTGISKFDLCLELDDHPSGIVGRFKYSTDLFDPATIDRMAAHLTTLVQSIVANPDQRISHLDILPAREREQICLEWNNTAAELPAGRRIHDLFTDHARRAPEAIAVQAGDRRLTYEDLDRLSTRLAAMLRNSGVGPETTVGLFLDPSVDLAVAILAILKAGGACVPLDPSYPAERVSQIIQEAQLQVVLTQETLRSELPSQQAKVISIDSLNLSADNVAFVDDVRPDNLAFVFFTSGSTGKPKGVEITHANLVSSTHARALYYGTDPARFLLLSSIGFDSSLAGIFSTLCQGGCLILTPGRLQSSLISLANLIEQNSVSHLLCIPSLYRLLLDQAKPRQLASLRVAIVAGESCPAELVERHNRIATQASLFNEYGPTEGTVWTTVYKCDPGKSLTAVPIGRPIPNAHVYVLDGHLNPLPIGVPGELYIGGAGVARGYLHQPAETKDRFIPDLFSPTSGARLYRTGDVVRYLSDGNLELLGRVDHQVKVRGVRVELEEIEAVIASCKGIRQVVAVLQAEQGTTQPKLVAYVVPDHSSEFDPDNLLGFLRNRLPEAMVPAIVLPLKAMPLTPNGKIDRKALPALLHLLPTCQSEEPVSEVESELLKSWETVLGKQGFAVTDNFFDLGGHSLLAAKLLLRVEQRFGKKLSLANLFQAPTVRQMAAMFEQKTALPQDSAIVPIQPLGDRPALFWVRGGSFLLPLTRRLGLSQPVLGLHLSPSDAAGLPIPYTLEDISRALVANMREAQPQGPYYIAGLCVNGVIAYEMARQLTAEGQQVAFLGLFDAQNPAYYQDFSEESRSQFLLKKAGYHWAQFRRQALPDYVRERLTGIRRRASVRYWRIHHALGLRVEEKLLEDLDTIVHPASFVYRPGPYQGAIAFFQSTDWPKGRYWDFYASWNGLTNGNMKVFKISGGHESMFYEQNVDPLASNLQNCLAAAMLRNQMVDRQSA